MVFFLFCSGLWSKKQAYWHHIIRNAVFVILGGALLRPTAGAVVLLRKSTTLAKRPLARCEDTRGVLRDFRVAIHDEICHEHSLIGRRTCIMTEAENSPSATASPGLSTTRNNFTYIASDSAAAGATWVRVRVLWRPGAIVGRIQAER